MKDDGNEVLIIGGGIHGCALARELALRGRDVTVLEKSVPGAEASSAAGGILGPHLESNHGADFLELARYSLGLYPSWVRELEEATDVKVGFRRCGGLQACFRPDGLEALRTQAANMAAQGLPARWLEADEAVRLEPNLGEVLGAIHFPDEAQVHPPSLMEALTLSARRAGAHFVRDTVLSIEHEPLGVRCSSGLRRATAVVVAAGAWSATLPGSGLQSAAVQPARGQMLLLKASEPPCRSVIFSETGYVVPRTGGHVLVGSTLEFEGFHKAVTAAGVQDILQTALEILPSLAEATVEDAWSGFRPWTPDLLPILGPSVHEGLWLTTGHYRNGILLAPASARLLADSLTGVEPPLPTEPFSPARLAVESD